MASRASWVCVSGVLCFLTVFGAGSPRLRANDAAVESGPAVAMGGSGGVGAALAPQTVVIPSFSSGEELEYRAHVWKGFHFIGADVGDAKFTISQAQYEGHPSWRFEAKAT